MSKNKQIPLIYLILIVATLIAYVRVVQCDFISYDDPDYVTANTHVRNGVTIEAIRWAFTTGHAANWHPITWMSHMLDIQLFGLNPRWHHLTNLLFHIANTLLLFFIFHRMTKSQWKSAFVAALFALHPLHVESVAWVAERKDVLSTFFWLLTMGAYVNYVEHKTEYGRRRTEGGQGTGSETRGLEDLGTKSTPPLPVTPSPRLSLKVVLRYLAVIIFFALGLMAKPMLVTLPFVLLLMDFWPLQRMQVAGSWEQEARSENQNSSLERRPLPANKRKRKSNKRTTGQGNAPSVIRTQTSDLRPLSSVLGPLLLEKIPLFALSAFSCIVTYIVQRQGGAIRSAEVFPVGIRISNALVSYTIYIGKTIWPNNLAVYYPHHGMWPLWQVFGAALLLIAVTYISFREARRFPCLVFGWLWFTGTLVPVMGIVQAGTQSMADRYTYVPLIGLFVMVAWGIPGLLKKWQPTRPTRKETLWGASAVIFICLFAATWTQAGYWHNSIALYEHALNVTSHNDVIFNNRGNAYITLGNFKDAISDYDRAIEVNPRRPEPYINRGIAYAKLGNHGHAITDYNSAIRIYPDYADAYGNRGTAYSKLGNYRQAISDFDRAIEINSKLAWAYSGRGKSYGILGNPRQAISDFNRAVEIDPKYEEAYNNRGVAYGMLGDNKQAISDYDAAIEINHDYADAYYNRGVAYGELGDHRQAISDYDRTIAINPEFADAYNNRGVEYGKLGDQRRAIEDLQKAARFGNEDAKNSLISIGKSW